MKSLEELKRIAEHFNLYKTEYGRWDFKDNFTPETCLRLIEAVIFARDKMRCTGIDDIRTVSDRIFELEKSIETLNKTLKDSLKLSAELLGIKTKLEAPNEAGTGSEEIQK